MIETVADRFDWKNWRKAGPHHGRGFAFAKYKNLAAYVAVALDLEVDRESGRIRLGRAVAADDSGQAVNPDGIKNQVEGAIVQAASWTLQEQVAFDRRVSRVVTGRHIRSCVSRTFSAASRCTSSTGPVSLISALARGGKVRLRRLLPMRWPMLPDSASASCRLPASA